MKPALTRGLAAALSLDAYLRGEQNPPARHESPFRALARVVYARCPEGRPRRRDAGRFDDDGVLALWQAAWTTVEEVSLERWRDVNAAQTGRIRASALLDEVERRTRELDLDMTFDADDIEYAAGLRQDLDSLATAALVLCEMGDPRGRESCRRRALDRLQHAPDGYSYARAFLGLSMMNPYAWLPGNAAPGILAHALEQGVEVLADAWRPSVLQQVEEPHDRAREIREKAARESAEAAVRAAGPSLVVVRSVEHLPGSAEDGKGKPGKSTAPSARGEWAPFAGRAWPLTPVPDLAAARAELVAEFPYAVDLIDAVLRDLVGRPHVQVRPLLLVGGPGSGKSRFARRLAEVLGLGWQVYGAAGVADASFTGTSRQWSTGRASVPLQMLKRLSAASGLVILDELDKAGTGTNNGALWDALLPLLTADAAAFFDPYLEIATDLSAVSYVATANDVSALRRSHPALVDRFRVYGMPAPRLEDLPTVLRTVMADLRAERGLDEAWCPDLDGEEVGLIEQHYRAGGSLRLVRRLAETLVAGRDALAGRH
ncbi:AAA family ATPase [Methylobacterium sp. J-059]|uniref:AAA family ATPase n=1 Tax=Methylobacterium sp. J-059 TaxID=2836643 RepID=UPI001FBA22DB|nr:AAA family ATPase [Methylobacterium sp. J-059]MCJ2040954.1 AAA family ATPase [Methylobacterium sp. J-059]